MCISYGYYLLYWYSFEIEAAKKMLRNSMFAYRFIIHWSNQSKHNFIFINFFFFLFFVLNLNCAKYKENKMLWNQLKTEKKIEKNLLFLMILKRLLMQINFQSSFVISKTYSKKKSIGIRTTWISREFSWIFLILWIFVHFLWIYSKFTHWDCVKHYVGIWNPVWNVW